MSNFPLFIQRSVRSNRCPQTFREVLEFNELVKGCCVVSQTPKRITQRDEYSNSPYQYGIYTYRLTTEINLDLLEKAREVSLIVNKGCAPDDPNRVVTESIPFHQIRPGHFWDLQIPPQHKHEFMEKTVIFGGPLFGSQNLRLIFTGSQIRELFDHISLEMSHQGRGKEFLAI